METQTAAGMRNRPNSWTNVTKPKGACKHRVRLSFHLNSICDPGGGGVSQLGRSPDVMAFMFSLMINTVKFKKIQIFNTKTQEGRPLLALTH